MFVQMSGALLPSFSLFCPAIAQPLAEMLMQLVPMDVISQGDRRPLLHHCPEIAIRLTPIKAQETQPRMRRLQSQSTGSPQRSRDDKSDETNFSDLRREILVTFGGPDEHGTKGGFGGFAASCEREIADQTGSFALASWRILTKVRWQICTEIL